MSSEAKRVKILTLIELLLGLAIVICGIVLGIMGAATAAPYVLAGEGVVSMFFGARGALIANVPARIGKLATFGLIVLVIQLVCVGIVVCMVGPNNVAEDPVPVCLSVIPALLTLAIMLLSRGMAKRAER